MHNRTALSLLVTAGTFGLAVGSACEDSPPNIGSSFGDSGLDAFSPDPFDGGVDAGGSTDAGEDSGPAFVCSPLPDGGAPDSGAPIVVPCDEFLEHAVGPNSVWDVEAKKATLVLDVPPGTPPPVEGTYEFYYGAKVGDGFQAFANMQVDGNTLTATYASDAGALQHTYSSKLTIIDACGRTFEVPSLSFSDPEYEFGDRQAPNDYSAWCEQ